MHKNAFDRDSVRKRTLIEVIKTRNKKVERKKNKDQNGSGS